MPYIADPDDATVHAVALCLLAVAIRPADTGDDAFIRLPRAKLHELAAPEIRREDFYEAVRRLTEETDAIREATGTGKRPDVILDRVVDEVGEWETVLYDEFPDDDPEPEQVADLLTTVHGFDVTTPLPDDLLVRRRRREPVVHDEAQPRRCARCGETKATEHFLRRSSDPQDREYRRFQSYCKDCQKAALRANRPPDDRVRTDRYLLDRRGRPGARRPRGSGNPFTYTN